MGINYGSQTMGLIKSVGDLTYYTRNNKTISRKKILTNRSRTDLQLKNRCIQSEAGRLCNYFLEPIRLGFLQKKKYLTGSNVFVMLNRQSITATKNEVSGIYEAVVDYSKLILAQGSLFIPDVTSVVDAENHLISFTVKDFMEGGRLYPDDVLYAVIFEKKFHLAILSVLGKRSETGVKEVHIPAQMDMSSLEIYSFATNKKHKMSSPSLYLTS